MIRTQVYITEQERKQLGKLSRQSGKSQSELIREAIDFFCQSFSSENRLNLLRSARGIWKDRTDLSDFQKIRQELDRDFEE